MIYNVPLFRQKVDGCGSACVRSVAQYHGTQFCDGYVGKEITHIPTGGTWLQYLGLFLQNHRFKTQLWMEHGAMSTAQRSATQEYTLANGTHTPRVSLELMLRALEEGPLIVGGSAEGFCTAQGYETNETCGHFVIVHGYSNRRFKILDPDIAEPVMHWYDMTPEELCTTMKDATRTGDNGFLLALRRNR